MFLTHQAREVNKCQWNKANCALFGYLSPTIPAAGYRRLSWLKDHFWRHAATDIWVKGKFSLALKGNENHYVHGSLSELCNYQISYKFQFSLVLILHYVYELAGSSPPPVKLWSLEQSVIQPLLQALLSPSRQQQKEIYGIILGAFHWALVHKDAGLIQLLDPAVNPTNSGGDFKMYLLSVLLKILLTIH